MCVMTPAPVALRHVERSLTSAEHAVVLDIGGIFMSQVNVALL